MEFLISATSNMTVKERKNLEDRKAANKTLRPKTPIQLILCKKSAYRKILLIGNTFIYVKSV